MINLYIFLHMLHISSSHLFFVITFQCAAHHLEKLIKTCCSVFNKMYVCHTE